VGIAGVGGRTSIIGHLGLFLKVRGILEKQVDVVKQFLLLEDVERGDLFQLDVEGVAEDDLGVVGLDQRAGLIVAGGSVDGLLELVYSAKSVSAGRAERATEPDSEAGSPPAGSGGLTVS
jgi:hypothetical protein